MQLLGKEILFQINKHFLLSKFSKCLIKRLIINTCGDLQH